MGEAAVCPACKHNNTDVSIHQVDPGARPREIPLEVAAKTYNRETRSKTCVESNIWSVVCAMELGLLTESSLKDVSIRMLSDDVRSGTLPPSWPFVVVGSDSKMEKKYVGEKTRKLKRQREAQRSLSVRKPSLKNKEVYFPNLPLRTIRNDRCNYKKIENSLSSDSAFEMSVEDDDGNSSFRNSTYEIVNEETFERLDNPKTEDSFEKDNNLCTEYNFIPSVINCEPSDERKISLSDSIEQDSDSFFTSTPTLKINTNDWSNECNEIIPSPRRLKSPELNDLQDVPLAERLSIEMMKEDIARSYNKNDYVCNVNNLIKENPVTVNDSVSNVSTIGIRKSVTRVDDNTRENDERKERKENSFGKKKEKENSWQDLRRITRGLTKINEAVSKENFLGRLVWGSCSGWWPALIIDAEHAGMLAESGKLWVYWIGESLISLLNEKTQIEPFTNSLESRLGQKLESESRRVAIDLTMQMMREKSGCLLTKPYHVWVKRNFVDENGRKIEDRFNWNKEFKITTDYRIARLNLFHLTQNYY